MSVTPIPAVPYSNLGWKMKMQMMDWHRHAMDRYPGWEIEKESAPAFVRLTHVHKKGPIASTALCEKWDDVAEVRFYQRDWTEDGLPRVNEGETYWSGWWFQTIAERDRFLKWYKE